MCSIESKKSATLTWLRFGTYKIDIMNLTRKFWKYLEWIILYKWTIGERNSLLHCFQLRFVLKSFYIQTMFGSLFLLRIKLNLPDSEAGVASTNIIRVKDEANALSIGLVKVFVWRRHSMNNYSYTRIDVLVFTWQQWIVSKALFRNKEIDYMLPFIKHFS